MTDLQVMQPMARKSGELVGRLAQPCPHCVRIDFKYSSYRPNTQAFGQSHDCAHDPLGRSRFAIQERTVRLQKVGITHDAVELAPGPTPGMAIRADIALPDPALRGARFGGTVRMIGVDRSWAPALGDEPSRRGQWWLIDVMLLLLTGCAVRLLGQAAKGVGAFASLLIR
jgi:hypothetical protein